MNSNSKPLNPMPTSSTQFSISSVLAALLCLVAPDLSGASADSASSGQEDTLIAVLKSDAAQKQKADACRELARVGTKDAVAALAALLDDEKLSHMARYGLETIADTSVDQALRDALGRLHGRLLVGVIGSIGVRRDPEAVKALSDLLRDADAGVAQAAAKALGRIATFPAAQALETALRNAPATNQLAFCEGLFRCAEGLSTKGGTGQATAIYDHLRSLPLPHQARAAALRGAVLTRREAGLPLLLEAIRSNDFSIFAAAARISHELPGSRVTLSLAGELEKAPADRQILLIQTLGWRADTHALPSLAHVARNGEQSVRIAAIRGLAEMEAAAGVPVLVQLLDDADRAIAQAAQQALAGLQGKEADRAVMALLARPEPNKRITGIDLIVRRRMTSAVPDLLKAAQDADDTVRLAAMKRLGLLAGAGDLPALLDLLAKAREGEDLDAAEQALNTLCTRTPEREACAGKIAACLPQAKPAQKCALLRVLSSAGGANALKCVRAAVSETEPQVHAAAIRALAGWNTAEAAPDLLELARNSGAAADKLLCLRAYLGFARQLNVPAPERLTMCRNAAGLVQSDDEKRLLLAALGAVESTDSLALIQPYLDDAAAKEEAANAVVSIAAKLLEGNQAAALAPKLVEPLDKAARVTTNTQLATRAKSLLDQARAKAK